MNLRLISVPLLFFSFFCEKLRKNHIKEAQEDDAGKKDAPVFVPCLNFRQQLLQERYHQLLLPPPESEKDAAKK
jgi:hypothetical protein